ncbi:MAG: AMP-binding protein [Duncaniella sp.]|nr:amino acid adenylation domain-containing protein [Bacteroides sp.]MDE6065670.1 AMP-binding protein [Duncaniella sp.]
MDTTIYSRFKELVTAQPDQPAIIDERSCVTYSGLDRMVDTLISRFPTFIPARVGVVMDHSLEMIAAIMAIIKCGAAFVPVEPDFPPERMNRFLTESGVDFVVTQEKYSSMLSDFTLFIVGSQITSASELYPLPDRCKADRPAYIMYTSSISGYPIGVMVGNRQVVEMARRFGQTFNISPDDVLLQYSACIVNIFIEEVFGTLLNGAVLAIPSAATRNNPQALMQFADDQYVSIISGFPYLLQELNRMPSLPITLRMLISGGDQLNPSSIGHLLEQLPVYHTYGPTEGTALTTCYCCNNGYSLASGNFPIGSPLDGVEVMLLDSELRPVADGEEGEICIAGSGVADSFTGDHRAEQLSSIAILPDGTRVARTGDIGIRLTDGNISYVRRKESEVNILGKRVVTGEVERALLATGEVSDCAVVHYQDEKGATYLVGYVVPTTSSFSLSWVKNRLAQYLPAYMIPEFFVLLRELPVTASGQVNTLALPVVLKDSAAG